MYKNIDLLLVIELYFKNRYVLLSPNNCFPPTLGQT